VPGLTTGTGVDCDWLEQKVILDEIAKVNPVITQSDKGRYYYCLYVKGLAAYRIMDIVKLEECKRGWSGGARGSRPVVAVTNCLMQVNAHQGGMHLSTSNRFGVKASNVYYLGQSSAVMRQAAAHLREEARHGCIKHGASSSSTV